MVQCCSFPWQNSHCLQEGRDEEGKVKQPLALWHKRSCCASCRVGTQQLHGSSTEHSRVSEFVASGTRTLQQPTRQHKTMLCIQHCRCAPWNGYLAHGKTTAPRDFYSKSTKKEARKHWSNTEVHWTDQAPQENNSCGHSRCLVLHIIETKSFCRGSETPLMHIFWKGMAWWFLLAEPVIGNNLLLSNGTTQMQRSTMH